jgi:NADPH:quinone reductase-like Zn-dependent oxidoreductase
MRQVFISKAGGPQVLQVRESPDPTAGNGEVRVRVKAAGINFADLMARMGLYPDAPKIPCVVGYEVAGVIDQVGAGITSYKVGDRVIGVPKFGGYTDTLVVPESNVLPMPPQMSFEEGAGFPVVYLTAHHMLLFVGSLRPGAKVLVHSAAGGVGLAAIQIGRAHGCELFGTASESKHDFLREQGCQHPLSYENYAQEVRAIVGDRGLDVVLDPVGGPSWRVGYNLLGPAGRLVCYGFSANNTGTSRNLLNVAWQVMRMPFFNAISLMNENRTVTGVNMGHLFAHVDIVRTQLVSLLKMYEAGQIKPTIDRTFPFSEAAAAHQYLHDRKARGKVLLVP